MNSTSAVEVIIQDTSPLLHSKPLSPHFGAGAGAVDEAGAAVDAAAGAAAGASAGFSADFSAGAACATVAGAGGGASSADARPMTAPAARASARERFRSLMVGSLTVLPCRFHPCGCARPDPGYKRRPCRHRFS